MNDRTDNERDDGLMRRASRLATDIPPQRDLWPDVENAI